VNDDAAAAERGRPGLIERRVLFVLEWLDWGGAERQAVHFADRLQRRHGARVSVIGLGRPGPVLESCAARGIPGRALRVGWASPRPRRALGVGRFIRAVRRERADAVVAFTMVPNVLAAVTRTCHGAGAVLWFQRDSGFNRQSAWLEKRALRLTDAFLANARSGVDFLVSTLGVDPSRVRLVPNGVETPHPRSSVKEWRERLGASPQAFVATMIANVHPPKDHETLLDAWETVVRGWRRPDRSPLLVLAGRVHAEREELLRRAEREPLAGHVRVLGAIDDVDGLLAASDLGVFSSLSEGTPNGVLETMAAGRPLVGSDLPGIRDAVGPAADALLVPVANARALAERVLHLADDDERRRSLGDSLARRAAEAFDPDRASDGLAEAISASLPDRPASF